MKALIKAGQMLWQEFLKRTFQRIRYNEHCIMKGLFDKVKVFLAFKPV